MHYLNHTQFMSKFAELWKDCKNEAFKLETLPEYDDFGIEDWRQVDAFRSQALIAEGQSDIYNSKDTYTEKLDNNVKVLRLRYVSYPITKYMLIEFSCYATSEAIGERIEIVEDKGLTKLSPYLKPYFCDFLLFDDLALLKADNPNGLTKCPAYFSEDRNELAPYIDLKNELLQLSQSFSEYMRMMNLKFVIVQPNGSQ